MANKEWKTQQNYDHERVKVDYKLKKKDPAKYGLSQDSFAVHTVPGQSVSIKELIERHEKGRPIPEE